MIWLHIKMLLQSLINIKILDSKSQKDKTVLPIKNS